MISPYLMIFIDQVHDKNYQVEDEVNRQETDMKMYIGHHIKWNANIQDDQEINDRNGDDMFRKTQQVNENVLINNVTSNIGDNYLPSEPLLSLQEVNTVNSADDTKSSSKDTDDHREIFQNLQETKDNRNDTEKILDQIINKTVHTSNDKNTGEKYISPEETSPVQAAVTLSLKEKPMNIQQTDGEKYISAETSLAVQEAGTVEPKFNNDNEMKIQQNGF